MDDQDLFIEKLNPDNPDQYLTPDGWAEIQSRSETIRINGEEPREVTLRWTRHGPVLPPKVYDVGAVTPEGHVAALSWTALTAEDRVLEYLLRNMRANSIDDAVEATVNALAPAVNVIMADQSGVGIVLAGQAPRRQSDSRSQGRIPSLGWVPENDWNGLIETIHPPQIWHRR